ncbi:uncharacterized protein IWZ02DRAFT_68205 [Phyllosticta citriasiana]|uniref:uncharacterized protein n=1 Tax=Phyllosticta citriasiana TaxID=595635 RepID=UPI0030FD9F06
MRVVRGMVVVVVLVLMVALVVLLDVLGSVLLHLPAAGAWVVGVCHDGGGGWLVGWLVVVEIDGWKWEREE